LRRFAGFFYKKIFNPTGYKIYQYSTKEIRKILRKEGFKIERMAALRHRIGRQIMIKARILN